MFGSGVSMLQRELPWNIIAGVGYAGSKASHIGNSVINWNDPVAPVAVFSQNLRPYPQFFDPARPDLGVQSTGRIRYIDSYGEGFYHGLQAKFDKRTSHDLSFGVAYTYSKSHGDGEAGGQEGASFQNPRDRRGSRGVYSFDQTHRTVANFVWELPGRTMKGFVGTVIGGWQLNGILTIASGFPFTITQGAGDLGLPNGSVRPDVVGDAELDNPTRKLWFNPQAFQRVTCQNRFASGPLSSGQRRLRPDARTRTAEPRLLDVQELPDQGAVQPAAPLGSLQLYQHAVVRKSRRDQLLECEPDHAERYARR